jgi:hypothetical protein
MEVLLIFGRMGKAQRTHQVRAQHKDSQDG